MFLLLLHTGRLTGKRLLILCSVAPFCRVRRWCVSLKEEEEKGVLFSLIRLCVCVSLCQCLYHSPHHKLINSPLSAHTHKHSETDSREDFRLPMPAPFVKLIRLRALDNSIISDSSDNRKPLRTAKASVTQYY